MASGINLQLDPRTGIVYKINSKDVQQSTFTFLDTEQGELFYNVHPDQLINVRRWLETAIEKAIANAGSRLVSETVYEPKEETQPGHQNQITVVYIRCFAKSRTDRNVRVDLGAASAAHHAIRIDFNENYAGELIPAWTETLRNSPLT